jgi:hypothetical protein
MRIAEHKFSFVMRSQWSSSRRLALATLAYALASLAHHVHNAEYLGAYPNMPDWLTRAGVYGAWALVTLVGVAGYLLYRSRYVRSGLVLLALYAALGLYGLAHYAVAPPAAHTTAMNLAIGCEVATAVVLLAVVIYAARRQFRVSVASVD